MLATEEKAILNTKRSYAIGVKFYRSGISALYLLIHTVPTLMVGGWSVSLGLCNDLDYTDRTDTTDEADS